MCGKGTFMYLIKMVLTLSTLTKHYKPAVLIYLHYVNNKSHLFMSTQIHL